MNKRLSESEYKCFPSYGFFVKMKENFFKSWSFVAKKKPEEKQA